MKIFEDIGTCFSTRGARVATGVMCMLFIAMLIFHIGVVVGSHHPFCQRQWREDSGREMPPPPQFGFGGKASIPMPQSFIRGEHGVVGTIVSIALPTITVTARDGSTQKVSLDSKTTVRGQNGSLTPADLHVGDGVVIMSEPNIQNNNEVDASIIRVIVASTTISR